MNLPLRRTALTAATLSMGALLAACGASDASPTASAPPPAASDPLPTASAASTPASVAAPTNPTPSLPPTSDATPSGQLTITGTPQQVTTGLEAPWSVAFLDGTPVISERDSARILELADDGTAREVGVVDGVAGSGEGGLLGIAIDDQSRLYAYSTGGDGNRIQRFDIKGAAGALALGEPETIIDRIPSASYHDGGRIAFGPDGMLYAAVGDAGQRDAAQDLSSPAGKILRMTPDGDVPESRLLSPTTSRSSST